MAVPRMAGNLLGGREYPAVLVYEIEKRLETKDRRLFCLELMFFVISLTCGVVLVMGVVGWWQ